MDYMCCDKCGSEFILRETLSSSVRCPDCSQWVDVEPLDNYSSSYYGKDYADSYVDFDADNYGYQD